MRDLSDSDEWLMSLVPIPGAVQKTHELAAHLGSYRTSRVQSRHPATLAWLQHHRFPTLPMILKPDNYQGPSELWKAQSMITDGVDSIVDDHPDLPKYLRQVGSTTHLFWFGQNTANGYNRLTPCPDWPTTVEKIKEHYGRTT